MPAASGGPRPPGEEPHRTNLPPETKVTPPKPRDSTTQKTEQIPVPGQNLYPGGKFKHQVKLVQAKGMKVIHLIRSILSKIFASLFKRPKPAEVGQELQSRVFTPAELVEQISTNPIPFFEAYAKSSDPEEQKEAKEAFNQRLLGAQQVLGYSGLAKLAKNAGKHLTVLSASNLKKEIDGELQEIRIKLTLKNSEKSSVEKDLDAKKKALVEERKQTITNVDYEKTVVLDRINHEWEKERAEYQQQIQQLEDLAPKKSTLRKKAGQLKAPVVDELKKKLHVIRKTKKIDVQMAAPAEKEAEDPKIQALKEVIVKRSEEINNERENQLESIDQRVKENAEKIRRLEQEITVFQTQLSEIDRALQVLNARRDTLREIKLKAELLPDIQVEAANVQPIERSFAQLMRMTVFHQIFQDFQESENQSDPKGFIKDYALNGGKLEQLRTRVMDQIPGEYSIFSFDLNRAFNSIIQEFSTSSIFQ